MFGIGSTEVMLVLAILAAILLISVLVIAFTIFRRSNK